MDAVTKHAAGPPQAVAEIVASYIVHMCGNVLADVHVNHGKYLPAGAQKALHTAVVELTRFDQELIIGLGPGHKQDKAEETPGWVEALIDDCVAKISRGLDHNQHNAPARILAAEDAVGRMATAMRRLARAVK